MRERGTVFGDTGWDHGNARVRAMKADLLRPRDYEALLGLPLERLIAALAETSYGPDVAAALPRYPPPLALQRAISTNLARSLRTVRGSYEGRPAEAVELLLGRWDLANTVTVLRGKARRAPPDEVVALIVPVGTVDEAVAAELSRRPGLVPAVELMVAWGAPRPEVARAVWRALPRFERTGDVAGIELAAVRAHWETVERALQAGVADGALEGALREEVDRRNVVVVLRLWASLRRGEPAERADEEAPLPGGRVPPEPLRAVVHLGSREEVVAELLRLPGTGWMRGPLLGWAAGGNLAELERRLEAAAALRAVGLFSRGDPLSAAVPVAFTFAKENEARNLRLLGYCAEVGMPRDAAREQLSVPGDPGWAG